MRGVRTTLQVPGVALADAILDSAATGLLLIDRNYRIVRVSRGLCDLLGYAEAELCGRPFTVLLHPEDRPVAQLAMLALSEGRRPANTVERRYLHKNGHMVWVIGKVAPLPGNPGPGEPAFAAQISPIDKQKAAEATAAEALERWSVALEGAGQGVWDIDVKNRTAFFSPGWKKMRGFPEGSEVEETEAEWLAMVHPDDRERVEMLVRQQNAGALDEVAYEYREQRRDGAGWIWILARGRCLEKLPDGRPSRMIGTDTDITEIKQRETAFAETSSRLRLAVTTSGIGIWEIDLATMVPSWDARVAEIFGCNPSDFDAPEGAWEALLHPEDRAAALAALRRAVASRTDDGCQYRIIRPDGEIRHVRSHATCANPGTEAERMVGITWDVTADVRRAAELEQANRLAVQRNRELEGARAAMEHASLHDSLTGLPNRRYLDQALARLSHRPPVGGLALLHIDLDRFKHINDTKGHAAGDAMLVHMAGLLTGLVANGDTVARIGGDEFIVMLTPAPRRQRLQALVDQIIAGAGKPFRWQGQECRCGASIGIAVARGTSDPRQLLVNADIALYRAKRMGRSCAAYFTDALQAEIVASKQCGDEIMAGLERGEFFPYYQPQFDARSLRITGVEALARWRHPARGVLAPDKFLDVAGEINATAAIDRAILEQTVRDLAAWQADGVPVPRASVNVSARRLTDPNLMASLKPLGLEPGRIAFELLESTYMDESDSAMAANIAAIRKLGIPIEIDDFGSGHASIVSLLQLNPARLKIDRRLVAPVTESEPQRRLVRAIVEIGRTQGIHICAEGVETAAHVEILRELGCDCLQGYYFGRPVPAGELRHIVTADGHFRGA